MIRNKLLFPFLAAGAALALVYRGSSRALARPATGPTATTIRSVEAMDAYIEEQMRRWNIPGASLAIVEGNKIVHMRGFGRARPSGEAPAPETPFFIGSLTKSFTALAVMQLVEAGKVELDAPVQRYLPWFRVADASASAHITVRHLLNQTSGLPMMAGEMLLGNFDHNPDSTQRQMRALFTLKPTHPAGAAFEYSNLNYTLLGLVIQAASSKDYAEYIQDNIFDPLGMRHSHTSRASAKRDGLAMGYRYWFGVPVAAGDLPIPIGSLPAGQLISSAEDMAHYLIAHLNGGRYGEVQILSEAGIEELLHGVAEINEMGLSLGSYGMGWISRGSGESRIVLHSGIVPDFGAFMALIPEQEKGIVLIYNTNHAVMKMTLDEMGMGAAERLAGQTPTPTRFDSAIWVLRGLPLIPVLQVAGIAGTLGMIRRWRGNPAQAPSRGQIWGRYILPPLVPNLLLAATPIVLLTGKMRGFMWLFLPDVSWISLISGGMAGLWALLRSLLILQCLPKRQPAESRLSSRSAV